MQKRKLLIIAPQALDLSLFFAGTAAKYAKNKWTVNAIVAGATNRDQEKSELFAAGKTIGLLNAYVLKNKTNELKKRGLDNLKMDIYDVLAEEKPDVVLTIARHGFSQNPEYAFVSQAATLAFEKYTALKLYYLCLPEQYLTFIQSKGFLRKDMYGYNFEGMPDKNISAVIDVKNQVKKKIAAIKCFASSNETSRMIELLKTYQSARMDYYVQYNTSNVKISNKL